ncbi:MAG: glycerol-3-phosphate dehydrogenase [Desulfuromonadales bacterium]|nr:glycerol-3-phosphate dehydrogenase [Desulfuromonadales bacterium]
MASRSYDVLVIGAGINGAGIARDLGLRGLRVALVEKGDFASGTSSTSTKLIHGGLRYLENFDLRLVFESCRERLILQRIAPHLVRPLSFFVPVYKGDKRPLWMVRVGLTLYDLLALFRNTHVHGLLSADEAVRQEPTLKREGLKGVVVYWDCRMDDARLCLENVISAAEVGVDVANYAEVVGLLHKGGEIVGARIVDREDKSEYEIAARMVINASGPWLDQVRSLDGPQEPVLRTTRGTHILVPRINSGSEAIYLSSGRDERLFFVIPWGEMSLIGTTDVDYSGAADAVEPTEEDITYLLEESARHLQGAGLTRSCVAAAFAGLRPLVRDKKSEHASQVSREHTLLQSPTGLLSVAGGKYTTYRAVAAQVARLVCRRLGYPARKANTDTLLLPGGIPGDFSQFLVDEKQRLLTHYAVDPMLIDRLLERYGSRAAAVLATTKNAPQLLQPVVAESSLTQLEVDYAVRFEMARTPADVLRRRTSLTLQVGQGLTELPAVARQMQRLLGVSDRQREEWEDHYRTHEVQTRENHDENRCQDH